jgi:hypothetical protein
VFFFSILLFSILLFSIFLFNFVVDRLLMGGSGASGSGDVQIFVKTVDGKTIAVRISLAAMVLVLRKMLEEEIGKSMDGIRISYASKDLNDMCTLESYGVEKGSNINLLAKGRGGMDWREAYGQGELTDDEVSNASGSADPVPQLVAETPAMQLADAAMPVVLAHAVNEAHDLVIRRIEEGIAKIEYNFNNAMDGSNVLARVNSIDADQGILEQQHERLDNRLDNTRRAMLIQLRKSNKRHQASEDNQAVLQQQIDGLKKEMKAMKAAKSKKPVKKTIKKAMKAKPMKAMKKHSHV